jgi:hypothetical protein
MVDKKTVDLPDFEDYDLIDNLEEAGQNGQTSAAVKPTAYTGVHSTSFKDMLLKPEIL